MGVSAGACFKAGLIGQHMVTIGSVIKYPVAQWWTWSSHRGRSGEDEQRRQFRDLDILRAVAWLLGDSSLATVSVETLLHLALDKLAWDSLKTLIILYWFHLPVFSKSLANTDHKLIS